MEDGSLCFIKKCCDPLVDGPKKTPERLIKIPKKQKDIYDWQMLARESQQIPQGDWTVWLLMAGRGFGKTRTGAETIRDWVKTGQCTRIALVADTVAEARMVMVEGVSGLLQISPPDERPQFIGGKGELIWPCGAMGFLYSSENYDRLRGPQFDGAWVDELAKFRYPQALWDQLMFSLRLGERPRVVITTTPRPITLLHNLIYSEHTHLTTGTSYENKENLSPIFVNQILKTYEGTTMGAQEIYAQILNESMGALWRRDLIKYKKPSFWPTPS